MTRIRTEYKVEADLTGDGTFTDLTGQVEDFDLTYGTDAESASSDITFHTATGRLIMLRTDDLADVSTVVSIRLTDQRTGRVQWDGRAIPSVHEELTTPDFLYWSLEGKYAFDLRTVNDYFIQPQSDIGTLDATVAKTFVDWSHADNQTSYITGEMTPAQLFNRLANVCGGYAYETLDGVVEFRNVGKVFAAQATHLLPAGLAPHSNSAVYDNAQTVRSRTVVRATNYLPDPNNPITVGIEDLQYRAYAYTPLLSFKPAPNRNLLITSWDAPTSPGDVTVVTAGGGGRYGRVRRPITGLAGTAELFYVPFIPAAGNRQDLGFSILFHASVSRLQAHDLRVAAPIANEETYGSVDANLAPWATPKSYQTTVRPWLDIRSKPLKFVSVEYAEAQDGPSSLDQIHQAQPGAYVLIELPKPSGDPILVPTLVLSVRINFGRGTVPVRKITGISTAGSPAIQPFDFEAEAFGPFDGKATLSITTPDSTKDAYCRYRKRGDSAWTDLTALGQDDEVVFGINNLDPSTSYEAQGGLESDYSDALSGTFTTDATESSSLTCTFDPVDENGAALTGVIETMIFAEDLGCFLLFVGTTLYQYDLGGEFVRQVTINLNEVFPSTFPANGLPAFNPQGATRTGRYLNGTLIGLTQFGSNGNPSTALPRRGDRLPGYQWYGQSNIGTTDRRVVAAVFNATAGGVMKIMAFRRYTASGITTAVVSASFGYDPNTGALEYYDFEDGAVDDGDYGGFMRLFTHSGDWYGAPIRPAGVTAGARRHSYIVDGTTATNQTIASVAWASAMTGAGANDLYTDSGVDWDGVNTDDPNGMLDFNPTGLSRIFQVYLTNDYNRLFALDDGTKRVWAFNRDGTECMTTATQPLLSAMTINGRPISRFTPTKTDYTSPTDRARISQFPNFYQGRWPITVSGIPFRATEEITRRTCVNTPFPGGTLAKCEVDVTDTVSGLTTTYKLNVINDILDEELDGASTPAPETPDDEEEPEPDDPAPFIRLSPTSVPLGATAVLEWGAAASATVRVDRVNNASADGTATVLTANIQNRTTTPGALNVSGTGVAGTFYYQITATLGSVTKYAAVTFTVTPPDVVSDDPVIDKFTASSIVVIAGAKPTLDWATTSATTVTLNGTSVPVDKTGHVVTPTAPSTTYTLRAENADGVAAESEIVISVLPPVVIPREEPKVPETIPEPVVVPPGDPDPTPALAAYIDGKELDPVTPRRVPVNVPIVLTLEVVALARWLVQVYGLESRKIRSLARNPAKRLTIVLTEPSQLRIWGWDKNNALKIRLSFSLPTVVLPPGPTIPIPEIPEAVKKPTGTLMVIPSILESESVTLRYTTLNAVSASIVTSRGLVRIPQRGLPLKSGFLLDTPASTRIYTLAMVGEDGKVVTVQARTMVTPLPTVTGVKIGDPSYNGLVPMSWVTTGDGVNITFGGRVFYVAGQVGARSLQLPLTVASERVVIQGAVTGKQVPKLAKTLVISEAAWDYGKITELNAAKVGEDFIRPIHRMETSGVTSDDLYVSKNSSGKALTTGKDFAYRGQGNMARLEMLSANRAGVIIPGDSVVRNSVARSFASGASFNSAVNSKVVNVHNIVQGCNTSCYLDFLNRGHTTVTTPVNNTGGMSRGVQQRITREALQVGPTPYSANVKYTVVTTSFNRQLIRTAGVVGAIALFLSWLSEAGEDEFEIEPAVLASTLTVTDSIFDILGDTSFPDADGATVQWTTPSINYEYDYDNPPRSLLLEPNFDQDPLQLKAFNKTYHGVIRSYDKQWVNPETGVTTVLTLPLMVLTPNDGNDFDAKLGAAIAHLDSRVSGARLGAIGEAEVLAER